MNWAHLKTIIWLRWRLGFNQLRKTGNLNTVLTLGFFICLLPSSAFLFITTLTVGIFVLPMASADHVFYVWCGIIIAFLFMWCMGLMVELQRSDAISIDKILHLPISLSGAFLVNYLGSLASISLIVFAPSMFALCLAMVIVQGAAALVMFPLLAGFLLMTTATTFQLRGWLSAIMQNKRHRRIVLAGMGMSFLLLAQTPNLVNMFFWRNAHKNNEAQVETYAEAARIYRKRQERVTQKIADLETALQAGEMTAETSQEKIAKFKIQVEELDQQVEKLKTVARARRQAATQKQFDDIRRAGLTASMIAPPGWLAYGSFSAMENRPLPGLLGALGSCLIGVISLRMSYRATVRFHQGDTSHKAAIRAAKKLREKKATPPRAPSRLLLRRLPLVSEETSTVALANFRSLTRAVESLMALISPVAMFVIMGAVLAFGPLSKMPESVKSLLPPLVALCVVGMANFGILMLQLNQFGIDRDGFRCYVLSPTPRKAILLGKNLSMAPFSFGLAGLGLLALQWGLPLHFSHLLASLVQLVSIFCISCLLGNQTSILAPFVMARGAMQKRNPNLTVILVQIAFLLLLPVAMLPVFLPLGAYYLLRFLGWGSVVPVYLLLSLGVLAVVLWGGHRILEYQSRLFQSREQQILAAVTEPAA